MSSVERDSEDIFAEGFVEAIKRRKQELSSLLYVRKTNVKKLRNKLGMSQYDFAEVYSIPLSTLQSWEQGRRVPDTLANILLGLIEDDPKLVAERIAKIKEM